MRGIPGRDLSLANFKLKSLSMFSPSQGSCHSEGTKITRIIINKFNLEFVKNIGDIIVREMVCLSECHEETQCRII